MLVYYTHTVTEDEVDGRGNVLTSQYMQWLEQAYWNFAAQIGMGRAELAEKGLYLVTRGLNSSFHHSCRMGHTLRISVQVQQLARLHLTLVYKIYTADSDRPLVTATSSHSFVDETEKSLPLYRAWPELYEKLRSMKSCVL